MKYGAVPLNQLPEQSTRKVMLVAERWQRAQWAHQRWAETAALSVDFMESRQYTNEIREALRRQRRVALTLNKINPIVRLMLGYQRSNKTDIRFQPGNDSLSTEDVAKTLTQLEKNVSAQNHQDYVDAAVFLDGLLGGRGWYSTTLDFEDNDLGEIKRVSKDPFTIYVDPDADTPDINESASFVFESKYTSIDEIEHTFGPKVAALVRPFVNGETPLSPISTAMINDETTPIRFFGQREDSINSWWDNFYANMGDFVDTRRKSIRICQMEHYVTELRDCLIDLETGDRRICPKEWDADKIQKILLYAQSIDNPLFHQKRQVKVPYITTMCGDLILYDRPSPYQRFTLTGYFPYFRRGVTRGVVEDLIDPQREVNKRRSIEVEIVSKLSNGGWKVHETSMRPDQEQKLKNFGSAPGFILKWRGDKEPEMLQPATSPMQHERLENKSNDDIRQISGVNESALGEVPNSSASGKALEARQRQAVISIQLYMDNLKFSKIQLGKQDIDIFQMHYSEPRIFRILGEDGKFSQLQINKLVTDPNNSAIKRILNDITVGKYTVTVDETPLSASFQGAQFEEMMSMLEKLGPVLGQQLGAFADLMIDASNMPRKDEWIERIQQVVLGPLGIVAAGMPVPPPGMVPPGQAPPGMQPGAPQGVAHQQGAPPMPMPPPAQPQAIPAPVQ